MITFSVHLYNMVFELHALQWTLTLAYLCLYVIWSPSRSNDLLQGRSHALSVFMIVFVFFFFPHFHRNIFIDSELPLSS